MAFYTGDVGCVELKRTSVNKVQVLLRPGSVNVERRRFSPEENLEGVFINGDLIDIATVDGSDLELVAGHNFNDWRGYVHVDMLGGLRLYDSFDGAIAGEKNEALELVSSNKKQLLTMQTRGDNFNALAHVTSFEFTTDRQTVDTTTLGNEFVQQYEAGLIAGQGVINCLWEWRAGMCDGRFSRRTQAEYVHYLAQLCIRLKEGADFFGRYYIYKGDADENSVWYEAECIVTQVSTSVEPGQLITSTVNFVTTGAFRLLTGIPPFFLLQEDGFSYILLENGDKILLQGE